MRSAEKEILTGNRRRYAMTLLNKIDQFADSLEEVVNGLTQDQELSVEELTALENILSCVGMILLANDRIELTDRPSDIEVK